MKLSDTICYIILSFTLSATFISIFFFTYIAKIEKNIVDLQIGNIADSISQYPKLFLTQKEKQIIKVKIQSYKKPDLSKEDKEVEEHNAELLKKTIKVFSILVSFGIFIVWAIYFKYKINLKQIILQSMIILGIICITYFLFITYVTQYYVLIDQNFIKREILILLKKRLIYKPTFEQPNEPEIPEIAEIPDINYNI